MPVMVKVLESDGELADDIATQSLGSCLYVWAICDVWDWNLLDSKLSIFEHQLW